MTRRRTNAKRIAGELAVDETNHTPLYHQIFLILRSKIHEGAYGEGDYLPGEYELARMYNVSRITAVRALNDLAAAGLVVRERGRGTRVPFVAAGTVVRGPTENANLALPRDAAGGGNFIDTLRVRENGNFHVLSFDYVAASAEVAQALEVPAKTQVQRAIRVLLLNGRPWNYLTTYVPADLGRNWKREDLETAPLISLIERSGVEVARIEERVTATLADMESAPKLQVAAGSPLIKIDRTAFDDRGRAVEHVLALYPPDRYLYAVSLTPAGRSVPRVVGAKRGKMAVATK